MDKRSWPMQISIPIKITISGPNQVSIVTTVSNEMLLINDTIFMNHEYWLQIDIINVCIYAIDVKKSKYAVYKAQNDTLQFKPAPGQLEERVIHVAGRNQAQHE